jgi:aspartate kinase
MKVFKFGGASVKDAASVRNVAEILKKYGNRETIVVISAMGKTTNKLEELVKAYFFGTKDPAALIAEVKKVHVDITKQLFTDINHPVFAEIENTFVELYWAVEEEPAFTYDHHYDQIVSQGEILSSHILSAYLRSNGVANRWMDARGLIQTDNTYREGKVDYELSAELVRNNLLAAVEEQGLVVTQGFIGGTSENYTTTLGREGSDYTAGLLAYFTDSTEVTIWKDVPGLLNADPKHFSNTEKIDELSYHDAIELSYYGASVIHPKTIKPLQNKSIPLYVKSFIDPEAGGTVIRDNDKRVTVTSYIFKERQILISIQPKDFSFIAEENLSEIFSIFSRHHVRVNMMHNSAISFSVCADDDRQRTQPMMDELKEHFRLLYNDNVQLMTIRNYNQDIIEKLSEGKTVLLEQRSRHTHQMVVKN